MNIFIVENNDNEIECAILAVENAGHVAVKCSDYTTWLIRRERKAFSIDIPEGMDGVITDLMFHTSPHYKEKPETPSGLLVVIEALYKSLPVVICTRESENGDNHHSESMSWIFDGFVMARRNEGRLPFGWEEEKNWDAAVKLLEQIHAQQKEKGGDK